MAEICTRPHPVLSGGLEDASGAGGPNANAGCDRAANQCEIHSWFETGGRRDDKNGIEANVAKGADGVTGASLGSE